jgi:uncharacterized protein YuzE
VIFSHDPEADVIYITIGNRRYDHGKDLDEERRIDYDADGNVLGIELLCVSHGVITDNLPFRAEIESYLEDKGIKIFA